MLPLETNELHGEDRHTQVATSEKLRNSKWPSGQVIEELCKGKGQSEVDIQTNLLKQVSFPGNSELEFGETQLAPRTKASSLGAGEASATISQRNRES